LIVCLGRDVLAENEFIFVICNPPLDT
jgi:hypothetical protein